MAFLGSALGVRGAPGANFAPPPDQAQLNQANTEAQSGLQQQQALIQALQAQNGLTNQSDVYKQLAGVAAGTGPNPAQAQLAQATGANVATQAALMAGQRGAGANAGLIARQAAQQGAQTQQQAVGQAASLQAQQGLNAIGQMGGIAGQQVQNQIGTTQGYATSAQNEQQNLLNARAQYNNALAGMQSNINTTNASRQNSVTAGMLGGISGAGAAAAGAATGGKVHSDHVGSNPILHQSNPKLEQSRVQLASGGFIENHITSNTPSNQTSISPLMDQGNPQGTAANINIRSGGGQKAPASQAPSDEAMSGGFAGKSQYQSSDFADSAGNQLGSQYMGAPSAPTAAPMPDKYGPGFAKGGRVPALLSPGEVYLSPKKVHEVKKGADPIQSGEHIPGKAKVKGDSLKNDIVPKTLEEGGIVLPRHVMESKHPHWEAHKFVSAILAKEGKIPKKKAKRG